MLRQPNVGGGRMKVDSTNTKNSMKFLLGCRITGINQIQPTKAQRFWQVLEKQLIILSLETIKRIFFHREIFTLPKTYKLVIKEFGEQ